MIEPTETQTQWPENGMRERIAELEAANDALYGDVQMYGAANGELKDLLDEALGNLKVATKLNAKWMDERTTAIMDKEQAELALAQERRAHAHDEKRADHHFVELAAAINVAAMARQTFDENGNGVRPLSEIEAEVRKDVRRVAGRTADA